MWRASQMRKISHMPAWQIYYAKVSPPEQRIIYLGSQILNWSFKTCITCGQHSYLHWTETYFASNGEGQNWPWLSNRSPWWTRKGQRKKQNLCFASVCCTQKKISVLLSATTVWQGFLLATLPAQALLSSRFILIYTFRAVSEAVQ